MTLSQPWLSMYPGELSAIVVQCHVAAVRVLRVTAPLCCHCGDCLLPKNGVCYIVRDSPLFFWLFFSKNFYRFGEVCYINLV